jgi:tetratricopeptide (TPR) repeat protein
MFSKFRQDRISRAAICVLVSSVLSVPAIAIAQQNAPASDNPKNAVLPLTTKSREARHLIDEAWTLYIDRVEQAQAIEKLHRAVKLDPDFAMGHELLAQISLDTAEQVNEQAKAFALRKHAAQPEQTFIEWYQDANDAKLIPAITKMNDVLSQYPHDKWVVWATSWWLMMQTQYERSIAVYEHSGITDSAGLMNNMGYDYAGIRQFDKAFAEMDKYVVAMPGDPNPQDSYAEILRMAGRFEQSVEHYRAALAINPEFYSSQFGVADTYSLMGDQVRARKEYEIGFQKFAIPQQHWVLWKTRAADTFVREGDYAGADKAFQAIADFAHLAHIDQVEADTYRQMAMYQQNPKQAMVLLDKADVAVQEGKNAMKSAIVEESAQILRLRVELAVKAGELEVARSMVVRLSELSESSNDKLVEVAYDGAAGTVAYSEGKYDEAISHLEEDVNSPLSLKLLAQAYQKIGYSAGVKRIDETLSNLNDPTLEQALVVPAFRKCYEDPACNGSLNAGTPKLRHTL